MRSIDHHHLARFALSLSLSFAVAALAACGRSSPDGGTDAAEIDAIARAAAFDTEAELTALLDDDYTTDAEVTVIATDVATTVATQITGDAVAALPFNDPATLNDDLRSELDAVYLAFDTTILQVSDVEDTARGVCFDSEAELVAELDDQYLPIDYLPDFVDLQNVPPDLADGDDNTIVSALLPLEINGTQVALDTTGCVNGEALVFQGGAFSCLTPTVPATPVTPVTAGAIGAAGANTRPFEALPIAIKTEVVNATIPAAGTPQDTAVYNVANPPPRNMLVIDAWAVVTTVTGTPSWNLRDGAGVDLTTAVPVGAVGDVTRIADFSGNVVQRTINTNELLNVRITGAAGDNATITVFILALPL
jgi:hypothetical protein